MSYLENPSNNPDSRFDDLSYDVREAIKAAKESMFEAVQYELKKGNVDSLDDLHTVIDEHYIDECAVLDVPTDGRIELIEFYSDEVGCDFSADADNLRRQLETFGAFIVGEFARESAHRGINALQEFMDAHGFELKNMVGGNNHGWARHYAERAEGRDCQVYEYRNLEGEGIHIDVWEYERDGLQVYFETTPEEVSEEEQNFDGS